MAISILEDIQPNMSFSIKTKYL